VGTRIPGPAGPSRHVTYTNPDDTEEVVETAAPAPSIKTISAHMSMIVPDAEEVVNKTSDSLDPVMDQKDEREFGGGDVTRCAGSLIDVLVSDTSAVGP